MEILRQTLNMWGISLSERQEEQFERYYMLLIQKNSVMNLTAITEKPEVEEKHFLDSLALTQAFQINGNESMIDLGTGAGFPGIPLKILFPDLHVVLADALDKRVGFLNDVIKELNLSDIAAVHARAEDLGHESGYRERFDLCVSRAVAALPVLAEYCLPLVKRGGIFAAYKSSRAEEEAESAQNAFEILGAGSSKIAQVSIGPSGYCRNLILVPKTSNTPEKYPRAAGKIKKKPL